MMRKTSGLKVLMIGRIFVHVFQNLWTLLRNVRRHIKFLKIIFFGTPCIWNCQKLALNSDNWLYVIGCVWEMFPMSSQETWHEIHGMRVTWVHFSKWIWTLNSKWTMHCCKLPKIYEWMQRTFHFWLFDLRVDIHFIRS